MLFFLIGIGIIGAEPTPWGFRPHLVSAPPAPWRPNTSLFIPYWLVNTDQFFGGFWKSCLIAVHVLCSHVLWVPCGDLLLLWLVVLELKENCCSPKPGSGKEFSVNFHDFPSGQMLQKCGSECFCEQTMRYFCAGRWMPARLRSGLRNKRSFHVFQRHIQVHLHTIATCKAPCIEQISHTSSCWRDQI